MTYTDSYFLVNKHEQLLKIVNFYEKQIEVLDEMLDEISERYNAVKSAKERKYFHEKFIEKQNLIHELKHNINVNNYLLTKDITQNHGKLTDTLIIENKHIEKDVVSFEREVNELSKDFKLYLLQI